MGAVVPVECAGRGIIRNRSSRRPFYVVYFWQTANSNYLRSYLKLKLTTEKLFMSFHIGLIGGGNITETHARAARAIPGVEISAIHGTNSEKIARLAREHGGTPYQDFDAFLKHRPMDLVVIGSPSGLHATKASPLPVKDCTS